MKYQLLIPILFSSIIAFAQTNPLTFREKKQGAVHEVYSVMENTMIKQGEYKFYYDNILLIEGFYYNDQKHGPWTKYYPDGTISSTGAYIEGQKNGIWQFVYQGGQLASISEFSKGEKTGKWVGYFMNGDTSSTMDFTLDSINSIKEHLTFYYQKEITEKKLPSKKQKEIITRDLYGKQLDQVSFYYENGNLYKQNFYLDNELDGPLTTYFKDGKEWESYRYDKGRLMEVNFIKSPYGDDLSSQLAEGTGTVKFYNYGGTLESEIDYQDGIEHGSAIYYHSGSKETVMKRAEGTFDEGYKTGLWKHYKPSGKLSRAITYFDNGNAHETYYKRGKVRQEADLLYGNYHGEVKEFNSYNELMSVHNYRNGHLHGSFMDDTNPLTQKGEYLFGDIANEVNYFKADQLRSTDTIYNQITVDSSFYELVDNEQTPYKRTSDFEQVNHHLKASFFGGWEKEAEHITYNIEYPELAKKNKVRGFVLLELTINSLGEVAETKLIKGIGYGCDEEAMRLVKSMPLFEPALYRGIPVESKLTRSIEFPRPVSREILVDFYKAGYTTSGRQSINAASFD